MAITVKARADDPATPLVHHWNVCVGAGRANEGLRAAWLEQLREAVAHCRFRYVRFHGLFHDDLFVYREVDGRPVYNFQYVDELFDRLLALGIRPFVELGFCPGDLASVKNTVFWWHAHGSPPKDYARWAELIRRFVVHVLERFGADEVRTWYFEVWNEPNLKPFFEGTRTQYFELYRVTVQTIKALDPQLRVGGPATSNFVPDERFAGETEDMVCQRALAQVTDLDSLTWKPVWLESFFAFCAREKLPVDFVSVHPYPTDWALDEHGTGHRSTRGVNATPQDLALVRTMVEASPFPDAEIHLTEWSSSASPRDFTHDYLQAATYVVRSNVASIGLVDSLAYWTFTDVFEESGAGDAPFHGGFGMINFQGIVKPTFHAYRFLAALGDELVARTPASIVTRHRATGKVTALAWHYPPEVPVTVPGAFGTRDAANATLAAGKGQELVVELNGLTPGGAIVIETLERNAGDAHSAWEAIGSPSWLTRAQIAELRRAALATRHESVAIAAVGAVHLRRPISPWSVVLLREV